MASVVHSRAYLLIEQELIKYEKYPVKGICLYPTRAGNLFSLSAKVKGIRDTLWDGAVLKLRLKFSESYNYVPPEANFVTVPFHPNVEAETGRVACPYLDDPQKWNPSVTFADILGSIQCQLSSPEPGLVLNQEAADMLMQDYGQYKSVVAQCVQMSQIIENSPDQLRPLSPDGDSNSGAQQPQPIEIEYDPDFLARPATQPKLPQHKINFESYHSDWKGMATSKTAESGPFNPADIWRNADTVAAKLESHRRLKYGRGGQQQPEQQQQPQLQKRQHLEANLVRLDQMRRLYLSQRHSSNVSTNRSFNDRKAVSGAPDTLHHQQHHIGTSLSHHYPEEDLEADDLVQWTQDLPDEELQAVKS